MNKLLNDIAREIRPEKDVKKEVDAFIRKINEIIKKNKIRAEAVAGGSIAKGTFLRDAYDIDIFVKFDLKYKEKDLSSMLEKILESFNPVKIYGSRDYYQIKNEYNYEIVPVLDIKKVEDAVNVTDMSPLHAIWVRKYIKENKSLADEIRLAKHFCKAIDVYGAESYIRGFSGHVLDILTIYYNSFFNLLKNSKKWKEETVIDLYNYHKGKALFNLNKSKISPLVVIDPVDPERNAAAALDREKMEKFRKAAINFLKKPSRRFFERKKITKESLKKKGKNILILEIEPKKGKEDVIGAKLYKTLIYIKRRLYENEFKVLNYGWEWDKKKEALFYYVLKKDELDKERICVGPPLNLKWHVKKFKRKYKNTYTKKGKVYARINRKFRTASELINNLKSSNYMKEKTKKIKINPL